MQHLAEKTMTEKIQASAWEIDIARSLFDEEYYLRVNDDVRKAGVDAFSHFMSHGAREGRKPNNALDLRPYAAANPSSVASGNNPFLHYLRVGMLSKTRLPAVNEEFETVLRSSPPSAYQKICANGEIPSDLIEAEQLSQLLALHLRSGTGKCVMALSHTHYLSETGGVENVVAAESTAFLRNRWSYIHVSPLNRTSHLVDRPGGETSLLVLAINGKRAGTISDVVLAAGLNEASRHSEGCPRLVIHHLLGFDIQSVLILAAVCGGSTPIVWIHDFYTLCVDPFLLRNDVEFCRAPDLGSNACMVCSKGRLRNLHAKNMRRLFKVLQPRVLAPSKAALDVWLERGDFSHREASIVPLAHLSPEGAPRGVTINPQRPLRVAHLGSTAAVKGWPVFHRLAVLLRGDPRYAFYRLGHGQSGDKGVTEVPVKVTSDDPGAMVRAVEDQEIDLVVNWSKCFETFSFVTYEALASGAFVIARQASGNIRSVIAGAGSGRGMTLRTEVELFALFLSGEVIALQRGARTHGQVVRTDATAPLLIGQHARA